MKSVFSWLTKSYIQNDPKTIESVWPRSLAPLPPLTVPTQPALSIFTSSTDSTPTVTPLSSAGTASSFTFSPASSPETKSFKRRNAITPTTESPLTSPRTPSQHEEITKEMADYVTQKKQVEQHRLSLEKLSDANISALFWWSTYMSCSKGFRSAFDTRVIIERNQRDHLVASKDDWLNWPISSHNYTADFEEIIKPAEEVKEVLRSIVSTTIHILVKHVTNLYNTFLLPEMTDPAYCQVIGETEKLTEALCFRSKTPVILSTSAAQKLERQFVESAQASFNRIFAGEGLAFEAPQHLQLQKICQWIRIIFQTHNWWQRLGENNKIMMIVFAALVYVGEVAAAISAHRQWTAKLKLSMAQRVHTNGRTCGTVAYLDRHDSDDRVRFPCKISPGTPTMYALQHSTIHTSF